MFTTIWFFLAFLAISSGLHSAFVAEPQYRRYAWVEIPVGVCMLGAFHLARLYGMV